MEILEGKKTENHLKNIIHADTQVSERGIDLTVSKIYETKNKGEIDFGGGERKDSEITEIEPELRNSDDDYGWWELDPGTYFIEYNEELSTDELTFIQPLPRLNRNSTTHPTLIISDLDLMPLRVGGEGISIKENSRVSRLFIVK